MNPFSLLFLGCGLLALPFLTVDPQPTSAPDAGDPHASVAENRYVGQKVCKNCHSKAEKGEVFEKWEASPHAKAFETLGTDAAKKIAAELKIDDPQKSEKCLECHVTAFDADKKLIKRGFKAEDGVQCESCHGPGEEHFKARFKASQSDEDSPLGADEVHSGRDPASCLKCHNDRSPTYKEFCFKERMAAMEHLDPRKERTPEELKKLRDTCTPDCPKCKKDGDK